MSEEMVINPAAEAEEEERLHEQVKVRRDKLAALCEAGKNPYEITKYDWDTKTEEIRERFEELEGKTVRIAGRMMSRRVMGKASFMDLLDSTGRLQVYVRRDDVGEEDYADFKKWDIGDILGVEGTVFRTQKGEISVHTTHIVLLSKSLLPLPEKFHGLRDTDTRYRQRYVDLIVNPEVRETFYKRSRILTEIRRYLDEKGFLEVDTPILVPLEIGASARPFVTHHNTLDMDMYLRIETELYLKRLIVGGIDRVYEVGRIFRNEGMDTKHNPEFTTVELYQAYTDYKGMMDLVEELYTRLAQNVCGSTRITYQGVELDLGHWERLTMAESVKKYAGVDYYDWKSDEDARADRSPGEPSAAIRARVTKARERQSKRFGPDGPHCNAAMGQAEIRRFCALDDEGQALMKGAYEHMGLTARSYDRILRVARTIADLDESENIQTHHLAEAIQYRETEYFSV